MLLKTRRFTWVELVVVIGALAVLAFVVLVSIFATDRRQCRRQLRSVGLALLMYSGDYDGYFPVAYPNGGNSFEPLATDNYIANGKVWACPSRADLLTTAANSAYLYIGSGLRDDHPRATSTSLAHDRPDNHPDKWANVLFIDGHVEGGLPGRKPFLPAR